ncbi:MAG: DUF1501 domain-containing protein [Bryobacteraceae bacterium]|nr:DUF1501 domain-containing protein [Bryobacteraceae bacterium]
MLTKSRRQFLASAGRGFGAVAASSLLPSLAGAASPLAPKAAHQPARAKAVIYLYMHGGVSHVDTWDPKPELARFSGQTLPPSFVKGLKTSRIDFTKAIARGSAWPFRRHGQAGLEISDLFPHIASHADELALVRSCYGDAFDHAPAMYLSGTGSQFPGRPCLGSWVVYGLGSENQNLPAFVVMTDGAMKCGPQGYGAGFLPAVYQGTMFRGGRSPVLDLANPEGTSNATQSATLDLIGDLDRQHLAERPFDSDLEARLASYELAFRMQSEAPDAVDISKESEATKKLYGIGEPLSDDFGRKCLLARRLVERGVRFIQLYSGTHLGDDWDGAHNDLTGSHNKMAGKTDKPIAGLLKDLAARGLTDSTLVIWGSEFGRTPLAEGRNGRDHHPYAFSMWFTGAGVKGGQVIGATDDFGLRPVEKPMMAHDVNATILRMMGLDHLRLTYFYQGRDMRLTDVHGDNEFTQLLVRA